jgi:hypothetical protein
MNKLHKQNIDESNFKDESFTFLKFFNIKPFKI